MQFHIWHGHLWYKWALKRIGGEHVLLALRSFRWSWTYQVAGAYRQRALDVSPDCLLNRRRHNKGSFTTGSSYFDTSVIDQGGLEANNDFGRKRGQGLGGICKCWQTMVRCKREGLNIATMVELRSSIYWLRQVCSSASPRKWLGLSIQRWIDGQMSTLFSRERRLILSDQIRFVKVEQRPGKFGAEYEALSTQSKHTRATKPPWKYKYKYKYWCG